MICKFCNKEISDDSVFCNHCGAKVEHAEEMSQQGDLAEQEQETLQQEIPNSETTETTVSPPQSRYSDKTIGTIDKAILASIIAGALGIVIFFVLVIVAGGKNLFETYNSDLFPVIASIILMMIGLLGVIVKIVLVNYLDLGSFPDSQIKSVFAIILAVLCLGLSFWGFIDCGNADYSDEGSDYESDYGGGYYPSSTGTVSEYLGLSLKVTSIQKSGSYTYVYCSVENVSDLYGNATMYRYIKVKAVFKDRLGNIVDTDWTYAVDSAWLETGETKTFYYMVRDTSVTSATLSIMS